MTTHCRVLWPTSRSCWIDGKATFTIAMSSTTMNCAAQARAKTMVLFRGGMSRCPCFLTRPLRRVVATASSETQVSVVLLQHGEDIAGGIGEPRDRWAVGVALDAPVVLGEAVVALEPHARAPRARRRRRRYRARGSSGS